jgi:hypothetical protein
MPYDTWELISQGVCDSCEDCEDCASDEPWFSWSSCDLCGGGLGGMRHVAHAVKRVGVPHSDTEVDHLEICEDCLLNL